MSFQSLGSLSATFAGGATLAAVLATAPKVVERLEGEWMILPWLATHSDAVTPQPRAAASISITRAVAPPVRTRSTEVRMPKLPAVRNAPHTRLRAAL